MKEKYPLFVAWFDFILTLLGHIERFPKSVRFSLSDRMINLSLETMELIIGAIYTRERRHILRKINLNLEVMRIYIRLSHEKRYISTGQYEFLTERIEAAGRMIGGWAKTHEKSQRIV
jgi:hypothetical protein